MSDTLYVIRNDSYRLREYEYDTTVMSGFVPMLSDKYILLMILQDIAHIRTES